MKKQFLRAKWLNLIMLNYEVDADVLQPYLPPGTELDMWQGKPLMSMVGFLFHETSVLGVKWPLHTNFEEVNLRFYVRYNNGTEWKRGAVFVSEIVPKPMIAYMANTLYKEHYRALPMRHSITNTGDTHTCYQYEWKLKGRWNRLAASVLNERRPIQPDSAEAFIFEHYWGYNKLSATKTMEYQVEHISWNTGQVTDFVFDADVAELYGPDFEPWLKREPVSAFFADGSDIAVRMGGHIVAEPSLLPV